MRRWLLAGLCLAAAALPAPAGAAKEDPVLWSYAIPGQGFLQMDLPDAWVETDRDTKTRTVRFKTADGEHAELSIVIAWTTAPNPEFNGPAALRSLALEEGQEHLEQAVETRLTLRELRGPQTGGYYYSLRDRSPKKKWSAYATRGEVGLNTVRLQFAVLTSQPNRAEIRQALKMIAAARLVEAQPAPEARAVEAEKAAPSDDAQLEPPRPGGRS